MKILPTGIPEHIFAFPEKYDGEQCGISITDGDLDAVLVKCADALAETEDYLPPDFRSSCEEIIIDPETVKASESAKAYIYLKGEYENRN